MLGIRLLFPSAFLLTAITLSALVSICANRQPFSVRNVTQPTRGAGSPRWTFLRPAGRLPWHDFEGADAPNCGEIIPRIDG
jgi:hypothetical protein